MHHFAAVSCSCGLQGGGGNRIFLHPPGGTLKIPLDWRGGRTCTVLPLPCPPKPVLSNPEKVPNKSVPHVSSCEKLKAKSCPRDAQTWGWGGHGGTTGASSAHFWGDHT